MVTQTEQVPVKRSEKQPKNIDGQIQDSEKALGIESDFDRLLEASLYIDKMFLNYAVVTGIVAKPERIFGASAWADYLNGRNHAKNNLGRELDVDFILDLQKRLTSSSNPEVSGKLREQRVIGGSYDEGKPVTYLAEQVKAIEENPLLEFARPDNDPNGRTGYIIYPHDGENTKKLMRTGLEEICDWFNDAKKEGNCNPHALAAQLERKLISLHPFGDANGTLSRLLMNWSLESDGEAPVILEDPGEDILADVDTWSEQVQQGSKRFASYRKKAEFLEDAGISEISALFDLGPDRAFYNYIFRYLSKAPSLPINGDKHNHQLYEKFLADFNDELDRFQEYMRSTSTISTTQGSREVSQGGLISPETIQLVSSGDNTSMSEEVKKLFFADIEVYRGGIVHGVLDDEKICQLFTGYSGVGSGYRALKGASASPTSTREVNPKIVAESMEYYNKILAAAYFKKQHPNSANPYSNKIVEDLDTTIKQHVKGGVTIWNSPFASTSLNYGVSRGWARNFGLSHAKDANFGVLFKAKVPKEGIVMTFTRGPKGVNVSGIGDEQEILVAGGISPESISGIEIYAKSGSVGSPAFTAETMTEDGIQKVVISDRRGEFVTVRTYHRTLDRNRFEMVSEVVTDTPSVSAMEVPSLPMDANIETFIDYLTTPHISKLKYEEYKNIPNDLFIENIIKNNISKNFIYNKEINDKELNNFFKINKIYEIKNDNIKYNDEDLK